MSSFAQTYNFTNCGATGRTGPTQVQVNSTYAGSSLNGAVTINAPGIQEWTVPVSGTYLIQAEGGPQAVSPPGKGAIIRGEVALTAGDVLLILVGQQGLTVNSGGSFNAGSNRLNVADFHSGHGHSYYICMLISYLNRYKD